MGSAVEPPCAHLTPCAHPTPCAHRPGSATATPAPVPTVPVSPGQGSRGTLAMHSQELWIPMNSPNPTSAHPAVYFNASPLPCVRKAGWAALAHHRAFQFWHGGTPKHPRQCCESQWGPSGEDQEQAKPVRAGAVKTTPQIKAEATKPGINPLDPQGATREGPSTHRQRWDLLASPPAPK